jgi:hypothetical protein
MSGPIPTSAPKENMPADYSTAQEYSATREKFSYSVTHQALRFAAIFLSEKPKHERGRLAFASSISTAASASSSFVPSFVQSINANSDAKTGN